MTKPIKTLGDLRAELLDKGHKFADAADMPEIIRRNWPHAKYFAIYAIGYSDLLPGVEGSWVVETDVGIHDVPAVVMWR